MTDRNRTEDRDKVLFAFHQECDRPTAEQIITWTKRFPQYAEDIRAHAAVAWDWAMGKDSAAGELDQSLSARGYSQALNIMFDETHSSQNITLPCQNFQEMLAAAGRNIPDIARELNIARSVVADLVNGWMLVPVPERLAAALVSTLSTTRESFNSALEMAQQ